MSDANALREPWEGLDRQRQATLLGMWAFVASEILFFAALLLIYASCRHGRPEGFFAAARETDVVFGATNTLVLLTSSFVMTLAAQAAEAGWRRATVALLAATAGFGLAFLAIKGAEYHEDLAKHLFPGRGFPIPIAGAQLFFALYWTLTGVHAVHLSIGIALVARLAIILARRRLTPSSPEIRVTALYWHLVDIVWIILFPLLYLGGRS